MRVLCVDRSTAGLPWLKPVLGELGLQVIIATDGEEALDRVAAELPDLVLIGVSIRGLDGLEVCRRLAGEPRTAHLPVLMVGPQPDPAMRLRALEAGAIGLLTPPESRRALLLELKAALRLKRVAEAGLMHAEEIRQLAAARDALMRVSLVDLELMVGAARRAVALLHQAPGVHGALATEERRALRVADEELTSASETLRALQAVRALDSGEWSFEPSRVDPAAILAAATAGCGLRVSVAGSVEPDLELVADGALLEHALTALLHYLMARSDDAGGVEFSAVRRQPAGVRFELAVSGDVADVQPSTPLAHVLQLTLARMVAEAHGGSLSFRRGGGGLVLDLPPEPTSGAWPPPGLFTRAARAAEGTAPSAGAAAADWLASRTSLPAPPRPRRLLPPAAD